MLKKIIYSLMASVCYALGFPSPLLPKFFLGTSLSLVFYFSQLTGRLKSDFWVTYFYILGMAILGFYWIPETISEFGDIPLLYSYLVSIFFPFALMPHLFCFILFYKTVFKIMKRFSPPLRNLLIAFTLTMFEYFIPQQFPANIGHPYLLIAPYLGLAQIFGMPIFSFFSLWLALSILSIIKKENDLFGLFFYLVFLALSLLLPIKNNNQEKKSIRIRMVQANIGNFLKTDAEQGGVTSKEEVDYRLRKLSTLPSSEKIDLVIWPETAFPEVLNSSNMKKNANSTPAIIRDIVGQTNSKLFFGGYDQNTGTTESTIEATYNSSFLLNRDGVLEDVFHKQVLLPFGEGLPFGHLNKFMIPYLENHMSFFAKGDQFTLFNLDKGINFISAICYEILFSRYIRQYLNTPSIQANFIINLTNDSWYGRTAEPYQHLFLAHWRALEFNLPIIRMTNTGFSSILFPDGSESKRTKLFSQEVVDFNLETFKREPTLYQRFGIIPLCALFLLLYFTILVFLNRKTLRLAFKRNSLP